MFIVEEIKFMWLIIFLWIIFCFVKYLILGRYFIYKVNYDKNKSGKYNFKVKICKFVE